mmetsp:Transcript_104182/g.324919  ORF Transcript_104182/g.324919 Transcript_104182/m.324919 type:complete len:85 (+) Transcript_104182:854-1108(+)
MTSLKVRGTLGVVVVSVTVVAVVVVAVTEVAVDVSVVVVADVVDVDTVDVEAVEVVVLVSGQPSPCVAQQYAFFASPQPNRQLE